MLTEDGQQRIQDALLASAMRKLLTEPGAYVEAYLQPGSELSGYLQIDGDTVITDTELDAVRRVIDDARR